MSKRELIAICGLVSILLLLVNANPASSAVITPGRGGGSLNDSNIVPMIMPEITISGNSIVVLKPDGSDWVTLTGANRPIMRPLNANAGEQLDSGNVPLFNALNGTAWNWQYGWANGSLDKSLIPTGSKIWIEVLDQSPGMKTYDRNANNFYAPIFGTNGTPNIWRWYETMSMSHNAYTVTPGYGEYYATYNVYIGNATTGAPTAGYFGDTVTLTWTSIPEPATMTLLGTGIVYLLGSRRKQ